MLRASCILIVLALAAGPAAAEAPCKLGKECGDEAFVRWNAGDRERAVTLHARACDLGHGLSCTALGQIREQGLAGAADIKAALKLFEKACKLGEPKGCVSAGGVYFLGKQVKKNVAAAKKLLRRGCALGVSAACTAAASIEGASMPTDPAGRCEAGDSEACRQRGYELEDGQPPDRAGALALYQRACKLGDLAACAEAATHTETRDLKGARAAYQKACEVRGVAFACGQLARSYEAGRPGPDLRKSKAYHLLACPQASEQDGESCLALAQYHWAILFDGLPGPPITPEQREQVMRFAHGACSAQLADGCRILAETYDAARQGPEALEALRHACALGDAPSCRVGAAREPSRAADWTGCGQRTAARCQALFPAPAASAP